MEVFLRDVPEQVNENALAKFLRPHLSDLSIKTFSCQKAVGKRFANLTFLHKQDGQRFLERHGQVRQNSGRSVNSAHTRQLKMLGKNISCSISRHFPDQYHLRSLELEEKRANSKNDAVALKEMETPADAARDFVSSSVSCGVWAYEGSELVFVSHYILRQPGKLVFNEKELVLTTKNGKKIEFRYPTIESIAVGGISLPSMTLALWNAPRFFERPEGFQDDDLLQLLIEGFGINGMSQRNKIQWTRLSSIDAEHAKVASGCLAYRVELNSNTVAEQLRVLKNFHEIPPMTSLRTRVHQPREPYGVQLQKLRDLFATLHKEMPFPILFQLQKLAQNAYLEPSMIVELLPEIALMEKRSGTSVCVRAIRKLFCQLPIAGPETQADQLNCRNLTELLKTNEDFVRKEQVFPASEQQSDDVADIFRATVTVCGTYLYGPESETKNRVLRKFPSHHDYFLRVQFADEDGSPVFYDPSASNEQVFNVRFRNVLQGGISIAGRKYAFLGFSHSSLRAQTCWFMAPFVKEESLVYNKNVIYGMGDFSKIRSPAKCAARIGQAFSDTPTTVALGSAAIRIVPDVERNNRVFSDGVGTVSQSVLERIWNALPNKHLAKPTCFQIRHSGAKGMISVNSLLEEDVLNLRPSMVKFEGSDSTDIEICGAGYKPLPLYLNRQTIKILEDLGVDDNFFLDLQSKAVERLRRTTVNATNASTFLRNHSVGESFNLSWMISKLSKLSIFFQDDPFLRNVIEMAVLIELRALKHKSRILVEDGVVLYGIMDETGVLNEGEIFCTFDRGAGKRMAIIGEVIITRCPALHPGDVRLVHAVDVPGRIPALTTLQLYLLQSESIIYDRNATLKSQVEAADYPRLNPIDIGRTVETSDMTDFFLKFMETDQLGRIATLHQVLADQKEFGTQDEECKILANMHSTAVDYSKTGIPVNLTLMPRSNKFRPDFMAPGPHVFIQTGGINFEQEERSDGFRKFSYYESQKILGKLYRAIDEKEVFMDMHNRGSTSVANPDGVMINLWSYIQGKCRLIQYEHHLGWARDIREMYEDCLLNIMFEYSQSHSQPVSEIEVICGNILGKTGCQNKQQRELSTSMKEQFERDIDVIVKLIVKDDDTADYSEESLERSIACFAVSFEAGVSRRRGGELRSFKYIAAAVCLKEVSAMIN